MTFSWFSFLLGGLVNWARTAATYPRRLFGAPVGNDRPALNCQLSACKTNVVEEFIAASGEAVRELSTGIDWRIFLTWVRGAIRTETARDPQAREQSTAYN